MGFVNSVGKIFTVINKEDTSGWHNYWQWRPETSSDTTLSEVPKDENSGIPDVELAKGDWSNFAYDREMIRDTVLIPNGLNTWNEERYEMTGYINNINTANTQVLMEFHDKGYAGNIYEYAIGISNSYDKRESVSHWQNTNYYSYDGRGSVSDLVDGTGKVQMYHSYEPDGQTTLRFRGYIKNPYRYNAERVDYVPGIADFQYLRARYYAPNLGRFIQQDIVWGTITTPLSQNLFIYCQNNAVNFIDPTGHYLEEYEYYKNKVNKDISRMQNLLNNQPSGVSERQAIKSEIDYLRSSDNPDNQKIAIMTGQGSYASNTVNGNYIDKKKIVSENGSKRTGCESDGGNNFWQSIGNWFGNAFGAGTDVVNQYSYTKNLTWGWLPIRIDETVEYTELLSQYGDSSKPVSVYATGISPTWVNSAAGILFNSSIDESGINLAFDDISVYSEFKTDDNTTSGVGIMISLANLSVKVNSYSTVSNENNMEVTTKTGLTVDAWLILALLSGKVPNTQTSSPPPRVGVPQPVY